MSTPPLPSAFPHLQVDLTYPPERGMTLRDWFAGHALIGILQDPRFTKEGHKGTYTYESAHLSYLVADAMLEARKPLS